MICFQFQTTKLAFFTSNKDRTPLLSSSCLVYQYSCPGCSKSYLRKNESTLFNRTMEHAWKDPKSAVNRHFQSCCAWKEIVDMFEICGEEVNTKDFQVDAVQQYTKAITRCDNWLTLAFLEALAIKQHKPELNTGIRSCKELALF